MNINRSFEGALQAHRKGYQNGIKWLWNKPFFKKRFVTLFWWKKRHILKQAQDVAESSKNEEFVLSF